jgi:hypothetical protein
MTIENFQWLNGVWAFAICFLLHFFPLPWSYCHFMPLPMPSWVIKKIQSPLDNGGVSDGNQKDLIAI